jgi:hypothetical protein
MRSKHPVLISIPEGEFSLTKENLELGDLLAEPREALDVEVKEWLELTDANHRALVAKEIIALAIHGGGYRRTPKARFSRT